jgi:hypothetical protein
MKRNSRRDDSSGRNQPAPRLDVPAQIIQIIDVLGGHSGSGRGRDQDQGQGRGNNNQDAAPVEQDADRGQGRGDRGRGGRRNNREAQE